MGPVASQEAIKLLGTNGGGFFNVNSAFPFENPSGLANFVQMLSILVIPAGLTATFGRWVGNRRQGWAIYAAMFTVLMVAVAVVYVAETAGSPAQHAAGLAGTQPGGQGAPLRPGLDRALHGGHHGGLVRLGERRASTRSPGVGGLVPMFNMGTGEVIFGGVGSGLYGMLLFVLLAVFIAGLMVGRTPEYLGKKVESREVKLVMLGHAGRAAGRARGHRAGRGHQVRRAVDLQPRAAGLLRDALRLHLADQQQRLGVRRLHRLRPAQLARQRRARSGSRSPT